MDSTAMIYLACSAFGGAIAGFYLCLSMVWAYHKILQNWYADQDQDNG